MVLAAISLEKGYGYLKLVLILELHDNYKYNNFYHHTYNQAGTMPLNKGKEQVAP